MSTSKIHGYKAAYYAGKFLLWAGCVAFVIGLLKQNTATMITAVIILAIDFAGLRIVNRLIKADARREDAPTNSSHSTEL